jgi:putative lipoprotein
VGLAGAGYAGGALVFDAPYARWLSGAGVALGAGLAKEVYDEWWRGTYFSFKDLTWDVLGTGTGLVLSWAVDRLFFAPRGVGTGSAAALAPVRVTGAREGGGGVPGAMRLGLMFSRGAGGRPQGALRNDRNPSVVLLLSGGW